jgi:predicted metalloendopeptidase
MSDKRKTAVEWLIQQLTEKYVSDITPEEWFGMKGQAKALEREQIIDAFDGHPLTSRNSQNGEEYYEQTYGE